MYRFLKSQSTLTPAFATPGRAAGIRLRLTMAALALICLFGSTGCVHEPSQADLDKIYHDTSLTPTQRIAALNALAPDPVAEEEQQYAPYVIVVAVLIGGALLAKKVSDDRELASIDMSRAGQKRKRKPGEKGRGSDRARQPDRARAPEKALVADKPNWLERMSPNRAQNAAAGAEDAARDKQDEAEPVVRLPETQAEVDAIPQNQRGISYFTSRPLPLDNLREIEINVGGEMRRVFASEIEAKEVDDGHIPRVRAFTVDGKSIPWYEWELYNPYAHYVTLNGRDWHGLINGIVACWMKPENCHPSLWGYYEGVEKPEPEPEPEPVFEEEEVPEETVPGKADVYDPFKRNFAEPKPTKSRRRKIDREPEPEAEPLPEPPRRRRTRAARASKSVTPAPATVEETIDHLEPENLEFDLEALDDAISELYF